MIRVIVSHADYNELRCYTDRKLMRYENTAIQRHDE